MTAGSSCGMDDAARQAGLDLLRTGEEINLVALSEAPFRLAADDRLCVAQTELSSGRGFFAG